ncbi:MAG: Holliday junction resolvase RuvX [Saprospiraceae bacterium]|nr:Holliday junction resolvase RuvX [Saprospiraceae bacterium]
MARILAIDYGTVKIGLAATDPLQIIVSGMDTIPNAELIPFLKNYLAKEAVEKIVLGYPTHADGQPTMLVPKIEKLALQLTKHFSNIEVVFHDESLTSKHAREIILVTHKKKKRRDKKLVDKVSAILILQDYLKHY